MSSKKIIFVIVEGPSDDEAIGAILNRIYKKMKCTSKFYTMI